jgi:hypothetical protein
MEEPSVFHILEGEAEEVSSSPYGSVGRLFSGEGIEAVWVAKKDEEIDPGWFSQARVDLVAMLQGSLRLEFERPDLEPLVLGTGDLLLLPGGTRCRAYRWPRDAAIATVFLAVYPSPGSPGVPERRQRR